MSTRHISARIPHDIDRRLALLAAERDTTRQALIIEALEDIFKKYSAKD